MGAFSLAVVTACGEVAEPPTVNVGRVGRAETPVTTAAATSTSTTSTTFDLRRLAPVVRALHAFARPAAVPGRIPRVYRPSGHRAQVGTPVPTTVPPAPASGHGGCSGMAGAPPGAIVANTCSWSASANCVMNHENSARVVNRWYGSGIRLSYDGRHSASGLFQIVRGTWGRFRGYLYAAWAPASVQYERFQQLWSQSPRHWHGTGCAGT